VSATVKISLIARTDNVIKPDGALALVVRHARAVFALGTAHLFELVLGVAKYLANCPGTLGRETIVANSAPHSVMHHLQTAYLLVAVCEAHILGVAFLASRKIADAGTLADLAGRSTAIAAQTHVGTVLARSLAPGSMRAVASISFVPSAPYVLKPDFSCATTVIFDHLASIFEAHGRT
jgi:hypothetical protein